MDMYRYSLRGYSLTVPGRVIRLTVNAANAEDARRVAKIRCADFGPTVETPRRGARLVIEPRDGMDQAKAREFIDWRGTRVEVVG